MQNDGLHGDGHAGLATRWKLALGPLVALRETENQTEQGLVSSMRHIRSFHNLMKH